MSRFAGKGLRPDQLPPEIGSVLEILAGRGRMPPPGVEWEAWLGVVAHHRAAAEAGMPIPEAGAMPEAMRDRLLGMVRRARLRGMTRAAELVRLAKALEAGEVDYLAFKGPTLAAMLRTGGLRPSRDLDLLVRPESVERALACLEAEDYRPVYPFDLAKGEIELRHAELHHWVELHWHLGRLFDDFPQDRLDLWGSRTQVVIAGHPVQSPALEPLLVYLAWHGTRHLWARLFWVADFAQAMAAPGIDWERVMELAEATGLERMVALATVLARNLLSAPLPAALARRSRLMYMAERASSALARVWTGPPLHDREALYGMGGARYLMWHLGLRRGWRARAVVAAAALRPTHRDHGVVALPWPLAWLYPAIRLGRILSRPLRRRQARRENADR